MNAITEIKAVHKNVFVALAAAQAEMETVRKGSVNPAFKSRYADLADVLSAVLPALNAHGMALFHQMVLDGSDRVMRTALVHGESDTRIECDVPLIVQKNDMQGMKSAITYAKRIGSESVTGIAPEDDDGNAAAQAAPKREERQQTQQRREPELSGPDPVQIAVESLTGAQNLEALASIWASVRDVQREPRVIAAKDARKKALTPAITDDEIPY